jgi:hypothetical protein
MLDEKAFLVLAGKVILRARWEILFWLILPSL